MAWGPGQKWPLAIVPVIGLVLLLGLAPISAGALDGGAGGRIALDIDLSSPARLSVTKHRSVCGESKLSEEFLVSTDRGLANVFVTLEGVPGPYPPPRGLAVLDNVACVFVPHAQIMRVGQVLEIRNSDRVIHTAHAYDEERRTLFNAALPVYKRSVRRTLMRPGRYRIACDVGHTWMTAYVMVLDHPYAAVTDALGAYRIAGVPPGTYRLRFWHERLGIREEPVTIHPGVETITNLTWSRDGSSAPLNNWLEETP
jgi:hypothetical protein